jgi:hypothetical protein
VFAEHNVRLDWGRPIDPFVGEASQFANYVSPGQREAVRSAILLPPGETLIVGLPTGSGKSFVAQAPMLIGGPEGSLSVCVVPTTALAIDQARQTAKLLRARFPNRNVPPLAWFSGLDEEGRAAIKGAIREGRQRILYCSPEAVTGALLPTLYDCAKSGLLALSLTKRTWSASGAMASGRRSKCWQGLGAASWMSAPVRPSRPC